MAVAGPRSGVRLAERDGVAWAMCCATMTSSRLGSSGARKALAPGYAAARPLREMRCHFIGRRITQILFYHNRKKL